MIIMASHEASSVHIHFKFLQHTFMKTFNESRTKVLCGPPMFPCVREEVRRGKGREVGWVAGQAYEFGINLNHPQTIHHPPALWPTNHVIAFSRLTG